MYTKTDYKYEKAFPKQNTFANNLGLIKTCTKKFVCTCSAEVSNYSKHIDFDTGNQLERFIT